MTTSLYFIKKLCSHFTAASYKLYMHHARVTSSDPKSLCRSTSRFLILTFINFQNNDVTMTSMVLSDKYCAQIIIFVKTFLIQKSNCANSCVETVPYIINTFMVLGSFLLTYFELGRR